MKEFKKILIRSAKIIDTSSPFHSKKVDILISSSKVEDIGRNLPLPKGAKEIDASGLLLSQGWIDMRCHLGDPGYEHQEDLDSGREAALAGGFTSLCVLPNTSPIIQSKSDINYLTSKARGGMVDVLPIAALSRDLEGKEITEMMDLHTAGAIGFGDGFKSIWHPNVMLKALQYATNFNGLIFNSPEENLLNQNGHMHEGVVSTSLGSRGIPSIAEEMMVERDLSLLEHSLGRLHLNCISSAKSVDLIRKAKKKGLKITCDVAIHQLIFADEDMLPFDSNYKVKPPFRRKTDRQALIKGVIDGTIDAIVTDHHPLDSEHKDLEFDLASFGIIGFASFLPWLVTLSEKIPWEVLIEKVTTSPISILGLASSTIKIGSQANMTLFDPKEQWDYIAATNKSKSINNPAFGSKLTGKVKFVVKGSSLFE